MKKVFKQSEINFFYKQIFLGSSVIRLLHAYIGNTAFRIGLSNYLAEYAYKNTITENLWSHLSQASNRSHLSDILSTWTKQIGYPLLSVEKFLFEIDFIFVILFE
jgi:aminopeptidase N